jgi:hypothetical protein
MAHDLARFLVEILDGDAAQRVVSPSPFLLIDECANSPALLQVISQAAQMRIARGSAELWSQLRLRADGSHSQLTGRPDKFKEVVPDHDIGKPVQGFSWPDVRVVEAIVVNFLVADRLVVLTANSKNDAGGLRRLLTDHVRPVLEERHSDRFGLLVFMKSGKTPWDAYGARLMERLLSTERAVRPGFEYLRVSSQGTTPA